MGIAWNWAEDGKSVEVGGVVFEVVDGKLAELVEFGSRLDLAKRVYLMLRDARLSFVSGSADYEGACERVEHLLVELGRSEDRASKAAMDLDSFFRPDGLTGRFGQDGKSWTAFLDEAMARLGAASARI